MSDFWEITVRVIFFFGPYLVLLALGAWLVRFLYRRRAYIQEAVSGPDGGIPFRSIGVAGLVVAIIALAYVGETRSRNEREALINDLFHGLESGDPALARSTLYTLSDTRGFLGFRDGYHPAFSDYQRYWERARAAESKALSYRINEYYPAYDAAFYSDDPEVFAVYAPFALAQLGEPDGRVASSAAADTRVRFTSQLEQAIAAENYFAAYQFSIALIALEPPLPRWATPDGRLPDLLFYAGYFGHLSGRTDLSSGSAGMWLLLYLDLVEGDYALGYEIEPTYAAAARELLAEMGIYE